MHPVIVGKPALPALALSNDPVAAASTAAGEVFAQSGTPLRRSGLT